MFLATNLATTKLRKNKLDNPTWRSVGYRGAAVRKPWPAGQIWPAAHFRVDRMAMSTKNNSHKFPRLSMRDPDEFHLCLNLFTGISFLLWYNKTMLKRACTMFCLA